MRAHPRNIAELLGSATLSALEAESRRHHALLTAVKTSLPENLAIHCKHSILKSNHLILYVSSPMYATRIRFHADDILRSVQQTTGEGVSQLKVRNHMEPAGLAFQPRPPSAPSALSPLTLRHIQETASGYPDDELGDALKRLVVSLQKRCRAP